MSNKLTPENPPAFPVHGYKDSGMTLRDWFASKVLPSLIQLSTNPEYADPLLEEAEQKGVKPEDLLAMQAYRFADAMLAARQEGARHE